MEHYDFSILTPHLPSLAGMFWDLDGTLIINNEKLAHAVITNEIFKAAAQEFVEHNIQLCEYDVGPTHRLAGTPLPDIISYYSNKLGVALPTDDIIENIKQRRKNMPADDERVHVLPVFRQLLVFLKSNYVPRVIVTSSEFDRASRYVDRGKLHPCFDDYEKYIFIGHKPRPDPYSNARTYLMEFHRTYLPKENCLGLEDTPPGIKSCKAAGKVAIGHTMAWHVTDKKKLEKKLLSAGADYIINEPGEVVPVLLKAVRNMPEIEMTLQRRDYGASPGYKRLHLRLM